MKFHVGDQVRVVNYGHLCINKYEIVEGKAVLIKGVFDTSPHYVGEIGIIVKAENIQGEDTYAIEGTSKSAWFDNEQLELVHRPQYNPHTLNSH